MTLTDNWSLSSPRVYHLVHVHPDHSRIAKGDGRNERVGDSDALREIDGGRAKEGEQNNHRNHQHKADDIADEDGVHKIALLAFVPGVTDRASLVHPNQPGEDESAQAAGAAAKENRLGAK